MKKNIQIVEFEFRVTRNGPIWTKKTPTTVKFLSEAWILMDLVGNLENVSKLPSTYLYEFLELDRNKIYWDYLRNEISSNLQWFIDEKHFSKKFFWAFVRGFSEFSERPVPDPCAPPYLCGNCIREKCRLRRRAVRISVWSIIGLQAIRFWDCGTLGNVAF